MATTIKQSFSDYASNLELSTKQTSLVSNRRANVVKAIKQELTLHTDESKVIGSWDRNTLTRYLFEGDVDVMVVLHHGKNEDWDNADGTIKSLDKFKNILDDTYPDTPKRRDENCITMQFSEFRLDVVPAFKMTSGKYKIPDAVRKKWIYTDPISFADKITKVNKTMEGSFIPLIKMIKGWNREVGWPIRSFHLECMMYARYKTYTKSYTYNSMVKVFFEHLPDYLASPTYDPITGERVDLYLDNIATITKRQIAINKAKRAAEKSKEAFEDETKYPNNLSISIGEWKALLGEFFPAYG